MKQPSTDQECYNVLPGPENPTVVGRYGTVVEGWVVGENWCVQRRTSSSTTLSTRIFT